MSSISNRFSMRNTTGFATMISLGLAAALGLTGCSGASDEGSTVEPAADGVFKSVNLEALLSTEKIRLGTPVTYNDALGNGTVWVRNAVSPNVGCTAQVINRWFLFTSAICIAQLVTQGTTSVQVRFTQNPTATTNPNTTTKYNGPVDFRHSGALGLIFLRNGMTTCQGTRSSCSTFQRNTPENAVHQFFIESLPKPTASVYGVVGYGATSHNGTDFGNSRGGVMPFVSSRWESTPSAPFPLFEIKVGWNNSTHPCTRDDGSPLIPLVQERILHAGVAMPVSVNCDAATGTSRYLALTEAAVLTFINNTLGEFRQARSLPFTCGSGIDQASGLAAIHCDNDGSLYPG
jgi:hypothetical protein